MAGAFLDELRWPAPDHMLAVGSGSPGVQTAALIERIEAAFAEHRPSGVFVVGDTNSALAGALAAIKMGVPVLHIEAGVRSYDFQMPEELNRRMIDAVATRCYAPTARALAVLHTEGRGDAAMFSGDTLCEAVEAVRPRLDAALLGDGNPWGVRPGEFVLATVHRSENVDDPNCLAGVVDILSSLDRRVIFPVHPRTRRRLETAGLQDTLGPQVTIVDPLGYHDFLRLLRSAMGVLTDSGGVQQEASIFRVPCFTLRQNTEWVETLERGQNMLLGIDPAYVVPRLRETLASPDRLAAMRAAPTPFQPGAARRIIDAVLRQFHAGDLTITRSNYLRDGIPPVQSVAGIEAPVLS
jgi:UDP-N-acetylglucosamine 2-epimerase